ncbi:MAG TPA: ribonuclease H-like domain-containing protein [Candidatus Paceibacterota bacterium]
MRTVVFDIETANWFTEVGGNDPAALTIALVGIHDSETGYASFLEPDLPKLWKILENTDILVGWNSDHFDVPLLNKYYPGDLTKIKSLDLMNEIHASLGRRLRLDVVADGTLNAKKIGSGGQSTKWWRDGEVEKVREYCLKDVELTKKIFDYAVANSKVKYKELGKVREVALNTQDWLSQDAKPMTFTMGF